jgi:carbamoyl-phosphate synthase large subunit
VSRSSALASKATGFPIAKIAAKLAVGYTLDELPNDITRETPASFEPTLDYVVVKVPRFAFEKFPGADSTLGTQMKSVGEVMAIGRTFPEAWQKALRGLETGRAGWGADGKDQIDPERVREYLITPRPERPFYVKYALQSGMDEGQVARLTGYDPWFVGQFSEILHLEGRLRAFDIETVPPRLLRDAKRMGFSDEQLAYLLEGPLTTAPSGHPRPPTTNKQLPVVGRRSSVDNWLSAKNAQRSASSRPTTMSTPAPPNFRPLRPTCTRHMRPRARQSRPTGAR